MSDNIVGIEKPHPEWIGWSNEKRECFGTIPENIKNNKWFYIILIVVVAIVVYLLYRQYYM
jgi:hypothetical protein